ncbi:MAG: hypothetical protein LJF30_06315 [Acidobacteria bacterium]|jgi:hypothetical protein|nr:hypothetical protein [Acidobacteriota bacterium]
MSEKSTPDVESAGRLMVDWSAAFQAGLIAGTVFLFVNLILGPMAYGGNVWVWIRLLASPILGSDILAPPATFNAGALAAAAVVQYGVSMILTLTIAFVLHRWGLWVGILGGAVLGLAFYAINIYTFTYFFPWFYALGGWVMALSHVLFGAFAGGVYEVLEVEEWELEDGTVVQREA